MPLSSSSRGWSQLARQQQHLLLAEINPQQDPLLLLLLVMIAGSHSRRLQQQQQPLRMGTSALKSAWRFRSSFSCSPSLLVSLSTCQGWASTKSSS
jgi:hypothetical protein